MDKSVLPEPVGPVMIIRVGRVSVDTCISLSLSYKTSYFNNDIGGLLHRLDWDVFIASVEIQAACEYVGAGQTLERQLCSVGASAYGHNVGRYINIAHGLFGDVDDKLHRHDYYAQVVVLDLDFDCGADWELVVYQNGRAHV